MRFTVSSLKNGILIVNFSVINSDTSLLSTVNGTIQMIAVKRDQLRIVRSFTDVHSGGDARKIIHFDKNIFRLVYFLIFIFGFYLFIQKSFSGSSNGTLAVVNIETGQTQRVNTVRISLFSIEFNIIGCCWN